mgnify:CR=1 FL=1
MRDGTPPIRYPGVSFVITSESLIRPLGGDADIFDFSTLISFSHFLCVFTDNAESKSAQRPWIVRLGACVAEAEAVVGRVGQRADGLKYATCVFKPVARTTLPFCVTTMVFKRCRGGARAATWIRLHCKALENAALYKHSRSRNRIVKSFTHTMQPDEALMMHPFD